MNSENTFFFSQNTNLFIYPKTKLYFLITILSSSENNLYRF